MMAQKGSVIAKDSKCECKTESRKKKFTEPDRKQQGGSCKCSQRTRTLP